MGKLPGHLQLREVMVVTDGTEVAVAHGTGGQYLVLAFAGRCGPSWVCVPASDLAVDCVKDGRTSIWSVVHHSATGTVDVFRSCMDGSVRESVMLCSRLPRGRGVLAAA